MDEATPRVELAIPWVALRNVPGLSRREAHALLEQRGRPEAVFGCSRRDLPRGLSAATVAALTRAPDRDAALRELEDAARLGCEPLVLGGPDFPARLRQIPDPPLVLYRRGPLPQGPRVAMVGSRRATARGLDAAGAFAAELARAGVPVVSGLAYGVDTEAHRGALDAGGATVAVLASGLDRVSPVGNRGLAERILVQGGAWISEYPPGTPSLPHFFPERNRLISGLAHVVLVVEANERSGTMWTARHALEQDRPLMAVPGPIDSPSYGGSNRLLRDGAGVATEPADVLAMLSVSGAELPLFEDAPVPTSLAGRALASLRESGPATADALARALAIDGRELAAALLDLELAGSIERRGARISARRR